MNILNNLITLIHLYCIRGIFISILLILFSKLLFKQRANTYYPVLIIKWVILTYSALLLINLILAIAFPVQTESQVTFINRAFGPYFWAYWTMFFFSTLFPLLLVFKKLGNRLYFLLLVAVLMNIGWLFESFVSHMTSLHRDFATDLAPLLPLYREKMILLQGLYLGIIVLVVGNIFHFLIPQKMKA